MFNEIKDSDLIAMEFKYHPKCYTDFTFVCSKHWRTSLNENTTTPEVPTETCDFEAVKDYVSTKMMGNNEVASMKTMHAIYGLKVEDTRYRSKLKKRIVHFQNNFCFFKQIIIYQSLY